MSAGQDQGTVRATAEGVLVDSVDGDSAASVSADPDPMLRWLWNRADDGAARIDGDAGLLDQFRTLRVAYTQ